MCELTSGQKQANRILLSGSHVDIINYRETAEYIGRLEGVVRILRNEVQARNESLERMRHDHHAES
jgi:hypothetical protein